MGSKDTKLLKEMSHDERTAAKLCLLSTELRALFRNNSKSLLH